MVAATLDDPFRPRPPGGTAPGALLALAAHVVLVAALTLGVNWRASNPAVVSAELWSAVPQQAAPRAQEAAPPPEPPAPAPRPEPAPPPRAEKAPQPEPDIALERRKREQEKKRQAEQDARERKERELKERRERERKERVEKERRAEAERKERAAREERERKATEAQLARQRAENLRRIQAQAGTAAGTGAPGSTGTAARDSGPSASYAGRLVAHIKPNIVFTERVSGNPAAEVEVRAGPGGTVIARRLVRSSGIKEWDEAVLRAIDRAGTLPRDVDGRVPPVLIIAFRPND